MTDAITKFHKFIIILINSEKVFAELKYYLIIYDISEKIKSLRRFKSLLQSVKI
jgi:hypothetical protein